ncbi:MAG: AAA family ATPase [Alistipes sp.]|nr:AAA family ATPase [Alistipes sp.]
MNESNKNDIVEMLRRDTQRLIDEMLEREEAEKQTFRKYLVNGFDMLSSSTEQMDYLVAPLLPRVGVAALVGSSDSGKSTLLRGLAMAISSGARHYLGFELRPKHHSAIYISTEDDAAAIGALMQRQLEELCTPKEAYATLDFIFDTDNLMANLEAMLEDKPRDLVIVDAFADLYTGPMNENNRVRSFINAFSQLAIKHNTLVLFLHHTGKRTESLAPSKHNAIGSQGFEAKMRLMMELRQDPERHDIRHLCVVKGNYLSAQYKHDSIELRFTPALNFEATGERVPFALLRERNEERDDRAEQARAMRLDGMTLQQIADALGYKSPQSVSNLLNRL